MTFVIQFISLLLSGVKAIANFFVMIPEFSASFLSIFPSSLYACLVVCFGIVLAVRFLELLP